MEYILYVDEAGCPGRLPSNNSGVQPIFCITGLIIPYQSLVEITQNFLHLKRKFNPNYADKLKHDLELILFEIKGSDLRTDIKKKDRNKRRRAFGLLDKTLNLLEDNDCKILSRGYVKEPGSSFDGNAVYTSSMQWMCSSFERFLLENDASGIVIADSRLKPQNNKVSYSIFTKKFKRSGDEFPNVLEMPVFGHSENHVGLQITDWLASSLLYPIISHVYCTGHIQSVHVHPRYELIQKRYAERLKDLQYRYRHKDKYKGGITIIDGIEKARSAALIFS